MAEEKRCPRCFSKLDPPSYIDDPIRTPKGQAGENYKGVTYIKPIHITELQDLRKEQEISVGIPIGKRTTFTKINTNVSRFIDMYKSHILELRESTEKILEITGQTKEQYFNYDEEGNEYNENNHQLDWHDPNLETRKRVYIKAVHIEDLRHYLSVAPTMLLVNRFINANTVYNNDLIVACYALSCQQEFFYWQGFNSWSINYQEEDSCGAYHEYDADQYELRTVGGEQPHGSYQQVKLGSFWYEWLGTRGSHRRQGMNAYRSYNNYNTFMMDVAVYPDPSADIGQIESYELQEFNIIPTLVDETYGYPCVIDRDTFEKFSQPKIKSCGFLEDSSTSGKLSQATRSECGGTWEYYFRNQVSPLTQSSGIIEDGFHERKMDNSALVSPPMLPCALDQIGGNSYLESISLQGTNITGNHSILVPTNWSLSNTDTAEERTRKLLSKKKKLELTRVLTENSDLKFNINITQEVMETIYDPLGFYTQWVDIKFGNSYLLAKEDGVDFIAEEKHSYTTGVKKISFQLYLKPDTIDKSVKLTIQGNTWDRVEYADLGNYTNQDKIFAVNNNYIYFSGGQLGDRITINIANADVVLYAKEIPVKKWYASGYIVLDLTEEQKTSYIDKGCYIIINYYNVPSSYNEIKTPVINYDMPRGDSNRYYSATIDSYNWSHDKGFHSQYFGFEPVANLPSVIPLIPTAIKGEEGL